ncbi:MAG: glutamate--tRNA ligase [Bdellovibrionales bacterium]|nr:glutamate--tRNA ligase [Bdellovibrionales bacterium]
MKVRTRFAPSPTGFQHLGGFRTAMYAWLLAKHYNGSFLLRIEDTDRERLVPGAIKYIVESLTTLGITMDEGPSKQDLASIGEDYEGAPDIGGSYGPYIQSKRFVRYKEVAEQLVAKGIAYRCDMTAEELTAEREAQIARGEAPGYAGSSRNKNVSPDSVHVIRLRIPDNFAISFDDAVRGKISWENPPLRDPVLLKSDGSATYHLAATVDDHDMEITHVLRGEEWLATAPIHLYLYDQLGWQRPTFCHLSVILGNDGKKLSKRHGAVSLNEYLDQGYLPEAILNYVSLIGWSPGDGTDQEVFTTEELIKAFSLDGLSASSGVFDVQKLNWMNGVYIRSLPLQRFHELAAPLLEANGIHVSAEQWQLLGPQVQERSKLLPDMIPMLEFLKDDGFKADLAILEQKKVSAEEISAIVASAKEVLGDLEDYSVGALEAALKSIPDKLDMKVGKVFQTLRIVVTGSMATPPLAESFVALGKGRCLGRLTLG